MSHPDVGFGIHGFIYGGDPNWVRRRYYLFWVSVWNGAAGISACIALSLGIIPLELTKTIVENVAGLQMVLAPGFILGPMWEDRAKIKAGTVTVQTDSLTQTDDPNTTVATSSTQTGPAGAVPVDPPAAMPPPPGAAG